MSLSTVSNGAVINHSDVAQIVNVLQQPSGGQEARKYILEGNCYVANGYISNYVTSLSRGSTPVSVSIDQADITKSSFMNAPQTAHLTSGGFQCYAQFTSANADGVVAGNYTIQF